jgi:protocatechuate 3,4-dioxygenase beta subunit
MVTCRFGGDRTIPEVPVRVAKSLFLAIGLLSAARLLAQSPAIPDPPSGPLSAQARIAPAGEPGEPMVIKGQVFDPAGTTPVAGVLVYAYHTDIKGLYTPSGAQRPPRLQGWARTDAQGRYEFTTIRPAPYPGDGPPAHVHFYLSGAGYPKQEAEELRFQGDPKVTRDIAELSRREGRFGGVRPVTRGSDGVWRCTFDMKLHR